MVLPDPGPKLVVDNTPDPWGRDMSNTFMARDLMRSGLRPSDFPFGCEPLPQNDEGQDRYKFGITADYSKVRVDREVNKYYGPKGVPPPIAILGDPSTSRTIATVEGYKKALLFHITTGVPTIALDGCWMFGELVEVEQETCVKNLATPILASLSPGQHHFVLFDGDWATNENVRKAATTYRVLLEEHDVKTQFKDLSVDKGPRLGYDDWFVQQYGIDRAAWPKREDLLLQLAKDGKNIPANALIGGALSFMLGSQERFSNEFLDLNDRGAGSLLIKLIGSQNIKYVRDTGEWFQWTKVKETGRQQWLNLGPQPLNLVNAVAHYYYDRALVFEAHAKKYADNTEKVTSLLAQAKQYRAFAAGSCSNSQSRGSILKDLTNGGRREIYALSQDFDAKSWLLGVRNGVIDLRTGQLREETQEDLITRHCDVDYDPGASPIVEGRDVEHFLYSTCGMNHGVPDEAFYAYLKRRLGIALWGGNKLQSFEIWQGAGSDGKSALALMIQGALGDSANGGYSAATKPEIIMSGYRNQNPEGASPFLVLLRGARVVFASETKDNAQINESLVKQLTGGEKLLARANYQSGGSFKVDFTFFLMTNPMPNCANLDNALLTRLCIMPFKVRWQRHGEQLDDNKHLPLGDPWWVEEACNNMDVRRYLLRWMVEGCVAALSEGLGEVPTRCKEALNSYKEEADTIAAWLNEYGIVFEEKGVTLVADLYQSYKNYALSSGHQVLSTVSFVKRLLIKHPDKISRTKIQNSKSALQGIRFGA